MSANKYFYFRCFIQDFLLKDLLYGSKLKSTRKNIKKS